VTGSGGRANEAVKLRLAPKEATMSLSWLLAVIDGAVQVLDSVGRDVDARVLEAHRAQLVAGKQWPGATAEAFEIPIAGVYDS
jgi:hypothetical protein